MPSIDVNSPISSAASARLVLGVVPVRPGAGGIGGTLNPSWLGCSLLPFEGNEE